MIDELWERRGLVCHKPLYRVFEGDNAASFKEYLEYQCRLHRRYGEYLGILCHGTPDGLMAHTKAEGPDVLKYSDFWASIERGFGYTGRQTILFAACEAMADIERQAALAPATVDSVIGYSGRPSTPHALRLMAGIFALAPDSYEAVRLAIEDAGASRDRLTENFAMVDEFLRTHGVDPRNNPGFMPDPPDEDEGEILIHFRYWKVKRLPLISLRRR